MFEIKSAGAIRTMHSVFVEAKQDQGWMGWQLDTILDNHKRGRVWNQSFFDLDPHMRRSLSSALTRVANFSDDRDSEFEYWSRGIWSLDIPLETIVNRRLQLALRIDGPETLKQLHRFSGRYFGYSVPESPGSLYAFDIRYPQFDPRELIELIRSDVPHEWIITHMTERRLRG